MKRSYFLFALFILCSCTLFSQSIVPDLQDSSKWQVVNRSAGPFYENGKKGIRFNEVEGNGLMILKGGDFSNGTIELDIKGSSKMQQSFVGLAFHGKGIANYDAVYFRPFNFKTDDVLRRSHAVQYISMPNYDWEKLRTAFPGKYEKGIDPAPGPDDWFHAKIVVNGRRVVVYVNNQQQPSLEVDKLNDNNSGGLGLWLGNHSAGSFANLTITPADGTAAQTNQPASYALHP